MNGMYRIFLMVCNMSVTAGFVIVLVLAARLLLRRAPRSFSYCLWILVIKQVFHSCVDRDKAYDHPHHIQQVRA